MKYAGGSRRAHRHHRLRHGIKVREIHNALAFPVYRVADIEHPGRADVFVGMYTSDEPPIEVAGKWVHSAQADTDVYVIFHAMYLRRSTAVRIGATHFIRLIATNPSGQIMTANQHLLTPEQVAQLAKLADEYEREVPQPSESARTVRDDSQLATALARGRRHVGEPKGDSPRVNVRLTPALDVAIAAEAQARGVGRSDVVRDALVEHFTSRSA